MAKQPESWRTKWPERILSPVIPPKFSPRLPANYTEALRQSAQERLRTQRMRARAPSIRPTKQDTPPISQHPATTKSNADRAYLMGKLAAGPGDVTQALPVLSRIKSKDPTLTQKVDFVVQLIKDHKAEILNQIRKRKRLMMFGIPGAIAGAGLAGGLGYMAGKRSKRK